MSTLVQTSTSVPVTMVTAGTDESAWPSIRVRPTREAALPGLHAASMTDRDRSVNTGSGSGSGLVLGTRIDQKQDPDQETKPETGSRTRSGAGEDPVWEKIATG